MKPYLFLAFTVLLWLNIPCGAKDPGMSSTGPGTSLHLLIAASAGEDTIFIPADTYTVHETLRLQGLEDVCLWFEPGSEVLLDDIYLDILKLTGCRNVQIINGSFRHVDPLPYYDCHGAVMVLEHSSGITVDNCRVSGCGAMGFMILDCSDIEVLHCLVEDNSFTAFCLRSFNGLVIDHCIIRNNGRLFYSSGQLDQTDLMMMNNLITGNFTCLEGPVPAPGLRNAQQGR